MKQSWYENTDRFIPVQWQASILLELGIQKKIDQHRLLKGSSLFPSDFQNTEFHITPHQLIQLFSNSLNLCHEGSFPFLIGDRLLPGSCSEFSNALTHARDLSQTFDLLSKYPLISFPLLKCKVVRESGSTGLEWVDIFGIKEHRVRITEIAIKSVVSWIKWQSTMSIPWKFEFNYAKPNYFEEYEVHLGDETEERKYLFNSVRCRMMIENQYLFKPWPKGSENVFNIALNYLRENKKFDIQEGFCGEVRNKILTHLEKEISLELIADEFNTSASSFKRKLKQHNTGFQQLLDSCRSERAVELMAKNCFTNEQIAEKLKIRDISNFRRSFKKWTGFTPKDYRHRFHPA